MNIATAFARVDEVKMKIERLLKPSDNSLNSNSQEILKLIYKHVESFEEIAKTTLDTDLDELISTEARELEGIVDEIDSKSESNGFSLENLKQRINSFTSRLKMEEQRCADGLYNLIPTEEEGGDDDDNGDSISANVIGVSDVYQELKDKLTRQKVTSLVGMPGVGKTTLANKLFHDPAIVERFDHRVWIRMGKNCRVKDIPRRILAEIDPDDLRTFHEEDEEAVHEYLKERLRCIRYLIVLEDVWDRFAMYLLHHRYTWGKLDHPFLHPKGNSRILLTSRLQQLSHYRSSKILSWKTVTIRLLNKKESWDLLCDKVFHKGSSCPPQLEKAGKKISENCDGLPLMIVTVARLLSEEDTGTPEYWNAIAAKRNHQIFMDAYDEISKVLLPSYTYLPPLLQFCFLYVGLFPRNQEIPRTKLINLWVVDGFFELNIHISNDFDAIACLEELASNSIVMVYKKSLFNFAHSVKTCGLHSSLLHLSRQKDRETKFALVLSNPNDGLGDDIEGHHRLSFTSNALFGFKDVRASVEDKCAPVARSLLCFGPYHQYEVPLCFRLELLKELDALSIRFYEFPMEVLQLVQLRYLGLTSNGMIPPSISKLSRLKFLIVERHQNIRSCRHQSYLPVEIWGLQELRHLQVMGSDLPDPCGASLICLRKLINVSARSCTKAVLKGIPRLRELKIRIELLPYDDGKPLTHLNTYICNLSALKCIIVNPEVVPEVVPILIFAPLSLRKLSLSGMGHHWEKMRLIASLPDLKVLKLKNYAFQGPVWRVKEGDFPKLYSLEIEDTDLVEWQLGCGAFQRLSSLTIKSCFKLAKIRGVFGVNLSEIELNDCNPSCVDEIKKASKEHVSGILDVHSSWEVRKLKTKRYTLSKDRQVPQRLVVDGETDYNFLYNNIVMVVFSLFLGVISLFFLYFFWVPY